MELSVAKDQDAKVEDRVRFRRGVYQEKINMAPVATMRSQRVSLRFGDESSRIAYLNYCVSGRHNRS